MKTLSAFVFPVLLILVGATLLIVGAGQGQNMWVILGALLALIVGVIAVLMQLGIVTRTVGLAIGIGCAIGALGLTWRNYRSIAEVLEFTREKKRVDSLVIQGLKDIRTVELAYKQTNGGFTGDLRVLQGFLKEGRMSVVKAIGQKPDTLTEEEALALKLIVRDTVLISPLDTLFRTPRSMEGRRYAFDPDAFINSPVSGKPYILRAGVISSSGRNVPVFVAKDPTPMVPGGDTLMVGNLEKASTAGSWSGE